jgi:hypothetical protein
MVKLYKGEQRVFRNAFWSSLLGGNYPSFEEHITAKLRSLRSDFGDFDDTEHHLSYILYVLSAQYFCGEMKIADHFTTARVPSWDSEIIDLSYSIKQSTLSFSQFSEHVRGDIKELVLQSYLFKKYAPRFAVAPIGNTRPDIVLKGKTMYQLYRLYSGLMRRAASVVSRSAERPPLENWNAWLNESHRGFIDELIFSKDSRIRGYIGDQYLEGLKANRDIHYIGKLASAEIILRLIENRWQRFWPSDGTYGHLAPLQ